MTAPMVYAQPRFAPLPGSLRAPKWRAVVDELAAHPGEWAAVAEQIGFRTPLTTRQLNRYGVECTVRSNGGNTATVWMRYVGKTDAPLGVTTSGDSYPTTTYKWFMGERRTA